MATKETRTSQLPQVASLIATDKVVVLKAGVTSLADISTVTGAAFLGKSTDNLPEGGNLYFTTGRVKTKVQQMIQAGTGVTVTVNELAETLTISALGEVRSVNTKTGFVSLVTDDIPEGSNFFYFTNERVDDRVAALLYPGANVTLNYDDNLGRLTINSTGDVRSVNTKTGDVTLTTDDISQGITNKYYSDVLFSNSLLTKTTTDLAEGTNQYFTQLRVRTTPLAGLTSGADAQIESLDTVLGAFGKVQTQITSAKNTANTHISRTDNPHNVTKAQVGLDNVPNVNTSNASNITSGLLPDARLSSNVTQQGNTFNGLNQLVRLDALGKLPAIDGSQLTGLISQIANLSDVQLIDLQVGQTLSYNGTKWVNTTSATATVRHDYSGVYSYVGRAPQLSPEASAVWKITRIQVLTDGNVLTTTANNVTWTGRLTHSYS
jgi:Cu/Ag efflux protein CusF